MSTLIPKFIPKSVGALVEVAKAAAADDVLKGWARAAWVYAFTGPGQMSTREFAAYNIPGLRSESTVRNYQKAWQNAIDAGKATEVLPGDEFIQPDMPWSEGYDGKTLADTLTENPKAIREHLAKNPDLVVGAVKSLPSVAAVVTSAIASDSELTNEVNRKAFTHRSGIEAHFVGSLPEVSVDWDILTAGALRTLGRALRAERDGLWKPEGQTHTWLRLLSLQLNEREDGLTATDILDEIDKMLATASGSGV